ncbi:MAG: ATP-grasp fold domain protein DUF201-type [Rhodoglobus sp.]|nr:ATP-grasp fold domain protein DUF201-type [Rhodoglobus sp.]
MTASYKKVLVFPGTTLVGIEVLASLSPLPGFIVQGAGVDAAAGHRAGYAKYDHLPHVDDADFPGALAELVGRDSIDYVYPANDLAILALSQINLDGATVVSHPPETILIAASKIATHETFEPLGITPERVLAQPGNAAFPLFAKPDVSHSAIGAVAVQDPSSLRELEEATPGFWSNHLVTEMLVSDEVTVDCFSTPGGLLYAAPRTRDETDGGIAVVTSDRKDDDLVRMAEVIGRRLTFNGAWFFQAKKDVHGVYRLMEIGARLAGASGIRRAQGVNLAQLSILTAGQLPVRVYQTRFRFTARRAQGISEVHCIERFTSLYVDLDDTLILNGAINPPVEELVRFVKARGIPVALVTRHLKDPDVTLAEFGLADLFDRVFHATKGEPKMSFIAAEGNSVLIDDSFSERVAASHPNTLAVDASSANQLKWLFDAQ